MTRQANNTPGNVQYPASSSIKAVILINPGSGGFSENSQRLQDTLTFLQEQGWQVEHHFTDSQEDAQRQARAAAEQRMDLVVGVGGDGTLHALIQELKGSETALALLPGGTFNTWAQETGIPQDEMQAREILLSGCVRRMDLGNVNNEYFLLTTGIGLGGKVTHSTKQSGVKRFGIPGYLLTGLRLMLGYNSFRARVTIDGQVKDVNALQLVIGNTRTYGTTLKFTWKAFCDDGQLDICIIRDPGRLGRLRVMFDFLFGREQRRRWVDYYKARSVKISTAKPIAIQCDGEPLGYTPASIKIAPDALKVVVPQQTPEDIFSQHNTFSLKA